MTMKATFSIAMSMVAAAACGGSADLGQTQQGAGVSASDIAPCPSSPPPASPPASSSAPPSAPAPTPKPLRDPACGLPAGSRVFHTSIDEVQSAIQGQWVLCSENGLSHEEQDGVEFDGNRWHLLKQGASGFEPVYGVMNEGGLELIDTSEMNGKPTFQANFNLDRGGTVIANPVFTTGPEGMLINNNGVYSYYYVRATK